MPLNIWITIYLENKKSPSLSKGLKLLLTKREYPCGYRWKVKEPSAIIFSLNTKIEKQVSDGLETYL